MEKANNFPRVALRNIRYIYTSARGINHRIYRIFRRQFGGYERRLSGRRADRADDPETSEDKVASRRFRRPGERSDRVGATGYLSRCCLARTRRFDNKKIIFYRILSNQPRRR